MLLKHMFNKSEIAVNVKVKLSTKLKKYLK